MRVYAFGYFIFVTAISSSADTYYFNRNSVLTSERNFTRSINWTANADGTGKYAPSTLDDDFIADALNTSVWTAIDRDNYASNPSPNPSTTTNADALTFSVRGADVYSTTNEYVAIYRKDIIGNFDVSVKVVSQSGASAWAKAGIMVTCDFSNVAGCGGYLILAVTPGHKVNLQWASDANPSPDELDNSSAETGSSTLPKWLRLVKKGFNYTGYYKDSESAAWTQVGTSVSPYWEELDTKVGLFANSNNATATATWVLDDFKGSGPINATGHALSLAGTSTWADSSATVGFDADASSIDFTNYAGALNMGGQNGLFATYYDDDDFTGFSVSRVDSTVNFDWGTGVPATGLDGDYFSVLWEGWVVAPVTGTYTFYTHDDDASRLLVNGAKLIEDSYSSITTERTGSPTVALTAGQRIPIQYWMQEYTGSAAARLRWQCSACSPAVPKEIIPKRALYAGRISVTGNANLSAGTFTAADGLIEFSGTTGTTQIFTPRSAQTMPRILHSGASTLQLGTNSLTTLGFYQGAGVLDFNSLNLTTVAGGYNRGDLSIWDGTSTSFSNLAGRTITVAGNASFVGQSGNTLNMNPGSAWTLAVTGQLNARYATIANSNASVTAGTAYRSAAGSGNSNWTVNGTTFYWNRNSVHTSSTDFSKAYNWAYNADGTGIRPISTTDDWFDGVSLGSAWTFKDRDADESYGSYRVSGGQLILTGDGGDIWGATNEYSTLYRTDITGDFDVQVKLVSVNTTGGTGYKIGLMMADDMNTLGSGGYAKMNYHGTGKTEFSRDENTNLGEIESNSDAGAGLALPIWLRLVKSGTSVTAWYKTTENGAWTQNGAASTPQSTAANSHIALFVCAGSGTATAVFDHFQGGTNIATTDDGVSFNGTGTGADANATLSGARTVGSIDFTNYSGTFNFGSYTLTVSGGNATFTSTMGLTPGTGTLAFDAAWGVNSTLVPKSGATHPPVLKTNANQVTVSTNALLTTTYTQNGGTWDWGSGMTHSVSSIATSAASQMTFNTSTVNVTTGNADFSGLTTVNANTGTVAFTGTSGTQVLTPKSGQTHPTITHTGASTLQLATNDLSTLGFSQSAGVLDFNSRNLTTTSSGNFTLTNGTSSSFTNLGGRTLTIAGNGSFTGQSGNLVNLNPTSGWTAAATGTLSASYAIVANSNASVTTGVGTTSINGGGNTNWNLSAADYSAWNHNSSILFNTTASGANVSGNVTDFPLLVRLTANNFVFTQAKSDGSDIRFRDPDGTPLFYQIERWDATNKAAEIWVLVNQVDGNSDRDYITMHWGNNAAASESNGAAVFSGTANYRGVWHLAEDGNTTASGYADASSNLLHGTGSGLTSSSDVDAVIGKGSTFDGSSSRIAMGTNASLGSITSSFTVSAWVKSTTFQGSRLFAASRNTTSNGFGLGIGSSGEANGTTFGVVDYTTTGIGMTTGNWYHLTMVVDAAFDASFYLNGTFKQLITHTAAGTANTDDGYLLGANQATGGAYSEYLKGILDEVRVEGAIRSADWVKLSYETQRTGSTVLTFPNTALSNWSYSTKVYINTTASGANITTNQANYPLLVRLTPANFNFSQANSNGSDLRFADSAGALLSYEIERFDATNKAADIWVLIPTLKGSNNAQWFKMYWGRSTATSLSSGAAVFLGSAGYMGVWHIAEDGNVTTSGYRDATGSENHGTGIALDANTDVAAIVGKGSSFATASNQGIHVSHHASLHPTGNLTVQAWFNQYSQAAYRRIVSKPFTSAATPWNEFDLELNDPGNRAVFSLTLGGVEAGYATTSTLSIGTWYSVAGVYDGSAQKIYLNGAMETTGARTGTINDYAQPLAIGKYYHSTGSNWDGIIDEVRISNVARSADWLKLDYETMKAGSSVVTVGNRSPDYSKSIQFNFNTTNSGGGANVSGHVANIPLLVRLSSSNFDFTAVRNDGTDIQFVDKGGANLYHEVVEWDKGNKAGKVWVKVPQVDGNSTADFITLYYGCAGCTGSPYAVKDSVWSGYTSVFHLAAPEARAYDAAALGNHGNYVQNLPATTGITSASSVYFDGGTTSYIDVPNESNYDFLTNVSVSAWVKVATWPSDWAPIANHGDGGWRLHRNSNTNGAAFSMTKGGAPHDASSATNLNDGAWHHVVGTYDGSTLKVFVDGVVGATTVSTSGNLDVNNDAVAIGHNTTQTSRKWNGGISEVRLSNNSAVLSADFIKLSYENQKEGSTVVQTAITASSFTSSKVFKFNTTASGANVAGDVYDFPLLLRFTDATLINATQSAGQDIRFLDGDGVTWLDYQIERWDQTNNLGEIWVKVPQVDGNSAGDFITMYYNDVAGLTLPAGQCGTCVFGTANGFQGVWHLNEDGNVSANGYVDATSNGYHGQGVNIDNTDDVTGLAGLGQDLDGTNEYLTMSGTYPTGLNKRSLSIWAKADVAPVTAHKILANYGTGTANNNFGTYLSESTDAWTFFGWSGGDLGTGVAANTSWHHHFITYDGDSVRYYLDGTQIAVAQRTLGTPSSNLKIGARISDNLVTWDGIVDETRMANVVRSADWIKLEYQSQRSDATPLFNPSTAEFVSSKKYIFNTTRTGANVMGDVSNFPLLVRITGSTLVDAVQDDFDDIRFLDGDGKTWLNYHVERWSKTLDSAEVWVLVPKVDGNSDRDFITLYYNDLTNGAVANGECATCVFSTSNNFQAAWHLNNSLSDATSNALTGTNTGSTDGDGVSGTGRNFDGTDDYISFGNPNALKNIANSITVEAWIKTSLGAGGSYISAIRHDGHYTPIQLTTDGTTAWTAYWNTGLSLKGFTWDGVFDDNTWHHFVSQYDKDAGIRIWKDGVLIGSETTDLGALTTAGTNNFMLGATEGGTEDWTGKLDEVRVSDAFRDSNYIKLGYQTQRRAGNLFWNDRPGPNNKVTLTATPGTGAISLAWTTPVSDSANADSVGLWVKYSGTLDSVGATGQTKVVFLPKSDSAYAYPATYAGTYVFGLAVRNTAGQWSPFNRTSIDTVVQSGDDGMNDTIYVDSAIGNDANSCATARNPATPKFTLESADDCTATDTLVIRVMPGTYAGSSNETLDPNNGQFIVYTSFDLNSRAVLSGSGTGTHDGAARSWTVFLYGKAILRNLDVQCSVNGNSGVYLTEDQVVVEGCRIYNNGSLKHASGIHLGDDNNLNDVLIANNLIVEPTSYGIHNQTDDRFNFIGNTLIGDGATGTKGIYMDNEGNGTTTNTLTNNILVNWDYGMHIVDSDNNIGKVDNNLFHLVTSGREVVGETDANKLVKDPLFYVTAIRSPHAYKLLPGSPAIDAGTSTLNSSPWAPASNMDKDHFGSARTQGAARDIGAYEGTGFTPNPTGDFDTLTNTVSGNTVIVKNSKWKLVWDMARGGGITGFYDMTGDTTANLVAASSLLFDVRLDAHLASIQTSNSIAPTFSERTRARSIIRQRLALSASLDLNVWYTVYASGHIFIQSEIANLSSGALDMDVVQYNLKLASATAVTQSGGSLAGISYKNGFGYLTTSTKDAFLSVTQDLDTGAFGASETWSQVGSVAGSTDSVGFSIADMTDLAQNMKRHHHLLLYVGDGSLDFGKASALNADARNPSPVSMSAGTLIHERSWQDRLGGHWTFDEGAGVSAKDKSINFTNHATLTSTSWVSGKVGGALRFTTASVATVTDADPLEAGQDRTYMLWVKPDFAAMGNDAFVLSKGLTTSSGWHFRRVSGQSKIKFVMANVEVQSPTLTTGVWTHLTARVDGPRNVTLFVNGVLAEAGTAVATTTANADNLLIGKSGGDANAFAGDIDDVRIYHFNPPVGQLQAIVNRGFSTQYGHYHLRADNNNRVVALLNETVAQTRVQPAFEIDNWYGTKTPKYVYLNGTRLIPNVDFVVDSLVYGGIGAFGSNLILQVNKVLTGTSQTLFVDDNDSSGYMGEAGKMKTLSVTATANDKIAIQNFSGSTFGSASSGQWYLELDLNGWTTPTRATLTDTGFGEINVWKAAAVSPALAVSSATQMVGWGYKTGRALSYLKLDATTTPNETFTVGVGYSSPANLTYTLTDSSSTRLSLTLSTISLSAEGTASVSKRFTFYPTGRVFVSYVVSGATADFDTPRLDLNPRYNGGSSATAWSSATATANARWAFIDGDLDYHSIGLAMLSLKNAASTYTTAGGMLSSTATSSQFGANNDQRFAQFTMPTSVWTSANKPVTVNFMMDYSKDFTDSATADSLLRDAQTPAALTAITGTATTNDALDFNADGFAEGDGAYTYTASGTGLAHFKFVNTVTHFNPAFRIKSWSFSSVPEYVLVDNQTLTRGYHYNAYVNTGTSELVLQLNKTLAPGTHLFYISHKTGLAVSLNHFEAVGGEGVDSLKWSTESEFENLGFNLYRRVAPVQDLPDSLFAGAERTPGAGIANALLENLRTQAAAQAAAKAATSDTAGDTLPELSLSPEEIKALGYVRINAKLIPGAKGGSSASTQSYQFIDRTAGFGTTYEYILEAVDFSGTRVQYGPRKAKPRNPLETVLEPNYPNPFNPITTLRFSLKEKAKVSLVVYDARGRVVRTLIRPDKALLAGKYRLIWDARDDKGFEVPSGQYFYRFTAPKYHKTRKMILVK